MLFCLRRRNPSTFHVQFSLHVLMLISLKPYSNRSRDGGSSNILNMMTSRFSDDRVELTDDQARQQPHSRSLCLSLRLSLSFCLSLSLFFCSLSIFLPHTATLQKCLYAFSNTLSLCFNMVISHTDDLETQL